mmetsp:Transcript_61212/g.108858  ORF Transcript_61212/g.108858 Transcript_61212/m.108858 type:complete len:691 (-) Transcript_61212:171-2243(-)
MASSADWQAFDPGFDHGNVNVRKPNVPGAFGECEVDLGAADVRQRNVKGQVGDEQFCEVLAQTQVALSFNQSLWRTSAIALMLLLPWGLARPLALMLLDSDVLYLRLALLAVVLLLILGPLLGFVRVLLMVKGGELVFVRLAEDGRTLILSPGIHLLAGLGSEKQRFQVTDDVMMFGTMALIRIRPGFIGLGSDNGVPLFLLPGLHLLRAPNLQYQGVKSVNEDLIENGPLRLVRVRPGMVGLATLNGEPVVLDSGVHFINEASFMMDRSSGFKKADERLIQLGQLQIIVVPKGSIAAVLVNGEGHFLLEGRHFISHGRFSLVSMKTLSDEYISAGVRHRVLVPAGKLGLGLEAGEPELLEPGKIVLRDSSLFKYTGSVDITQAVITHGSLSIVTVRDGQFGISYHDGVIELLRPGRHMLKSATHVPGGFISAGQQTLRIAEVTGMSSDNVELRFDAAICMRVVDPQKAVVMLTQGKKDLMQELAANVQERAKLALSIIIGNNSLNRKHAGTMQMPSDEDAENLEEKTKEDENSFRQFIHDIFMRSFSDSMLKECGVQVIDMSIEDVVIVNTELATAMASAAVANSNLEKATIEAEIVQVTANADAKVALISAQGKAKAMSVTAHADAERIQALSEALEKSCLSAQQLEQIKASSAALGGTSTVMLAQDTGALATLLSGAQGSRLGPSLG